MKGELEKAIGSFRGIPEIKLKANHFRLILETDIILLYVRKKATF
jgi:hypothetical protein